MGDDSNKNRTYRSVNKDRVNECKREWYKRNRKKHIETVRKRKHEIVAIVTRMKATTPCADCGSLFPHYVMDFDHLPEKQKTFEIAAGKWNKGWKQILRELKSCEIVCSNCHRERTYQRSLAAAKEASSTVGDFPLLIGVDEPIVLESLPEQLELIS